MKEALKKVSGKGVGFTRGLFDFLKKYSVIGLAIGVITAQASKDLVDSIVKGVFTPLIKLLVPHSFTNLVFTFRGVTFDVGSIVNAGLTFIIVMAFLYFIIKTVLRKDGLLEKS